MGDNPILNAISPKAWDNRAAGLFLSGMCFFAYIVLSCLVPFALKRILYSTSPRTIYDWSLIFSASGWIIFWLCFIAFISIIYFHLYLYNAPFVVYDDRYRRIGYMHFDARRWIRFDEINRAIVYTNKKKEFRPNHSIRDSNEPTELVEYLLMGLEMKDGLRDLISEEDIGYGAFQDFIKILERKGIAVNMIDMRQVTDEPITDLTYFLVDDLDGAKGYRSPAEHEHANEGKVKEKIIQHIYYNDTRALSRKFSIGFLLMSLVFWPSVLLYPWAGPLSSPLPLGIVIIGAILFTLGGLLFPRPRDFQEILFTPTGLHFASMTNSRKIIVSKVFLSYKDIINIRSTGTDIQLATVWNKTYTVHAGITTKYWILLTLLRRTALSDENIDRALNRIVYPTFSI